MADSELADAQPISTQPEKSSARRGRGNGRARGDRQRGQRQNPTPSRPDLGAPIESSANAQPDNAPVSAHSLQSGIRNGEAADEEDQDGEVCFICASPVVHSSLAPCNHRTCHICSLRMRALYKSKACPHCRTAADRVVFTDEGEKRYEEYKIAEFVKQDDVLGINYESQDIFEDTLLLLRYNCPDASCDIACMGWPDLHRHVKSVHHKAMCDLCTRHKKVFTHEHELFTKDALRKHERFGDDHPGAVDQSGFTGHPECGFCRTRFYGEDELFTHCREKHERCHVCDARTSAKRPQYYQNYDALEKHFNKDHYPCLDRECQEKKFVVFGSEMDLKAHRIEAHPNDLSRDSRKVNISSFDYRTPHQEPTRSNRRDRGGRGRDPNADAPLPVSSAQPLRRDELAYQRTLAIQSAQSAAPRTFGGQLTQSNPRPVAPVQVQPQPQPESISTPSGPLSAQDQARQLRHAAVTERAANLLEKDANKMAEFRNKVSAYRSGAIKARTLIESFFSLFDTSPKELGKLIQELAEIFEIQARKDDLLRSWADWKAINEDYPSLPGPSSHASGLMPLNGLSEARILRLKSSTAQSGRKAVSDQGRWAPADNGKTTPSGPAFPALAIRSAPSAQQSRMNPPNRTAAATKASAAPTSNMFPALPAAAKPTSTIFSPGYTGRGIIRTSTPTTQNAWTSNTRTDVDAAQAPEPELSTGSASGKKGGKGKKQVLYAWG